ncbi:hypothetical protein VaNZ11_013645 [Volvox africanus]|uniref:Uracil-DNA glycosylase-like domain-containing protein n=1 Tax=Volvox africanus TaxID=51714 RepID=A0ABQ5SHH2_9CHLO|nr:hypothetical protein VaNZ11_013645 [Volvox africanus]
MSDATLSNAFQEYKCMSLHTSRAANNVRRTAMSASGGNTREILSARGKGSSSSSSFREGGMPFADATFTTVAHDPVLSAGPMAPAAKRARKVPTNPSPSSPLPPNFVVAMAPVTTGVATAVQPGSGGVVPGVSGGRGHAAHDISVSQGSIPTLAAPKSTSASNNFISPWPSAQLLTTPVVGTSTITVPTLLTTTGSATATEVAEPTSVCAAGAIGAPACLHPQAPACLEDTCNRIPSTSPIVTPTGRKTTRSTSWVPAGAAGSDATSSGRRTRSGSSKPSTSASPSPSLLVRGPRGVPPRGVPEKLGDRPLRLVIVGHNPSAHAWQSGHYYSHPANHMWRLLIATGIAPPGTRSAEDDDRLPAAAGVGFLDVGCGHPGTDSSSFSSEVFKSWSQAFYARLKAHMGRASASIGCSCGLCGAPSLVAFSGKRHYLELLNVGKPPRERVKTVEHGPQKLLPAGWPFPAAATEVWVCSSTSGAAALTRGQREAPYRRLAEKMRGIEWPRRVALKCISASSVPNNEARASLSDVGPTVKEATEAKAEGVETVTEGAEMEEGEEELVVVEGEEDVEDDAEET